MSDAETATFERRQARLARALQERREIEPEWFGKLRNLPEFKSLVAAAVPETDLLAEIAWARAGRDNFAVSARDRTDDLVAAARKLRAAAKTLRRLRGIKPAAAHQRDDGASFEAMATIAKMAGIEAFKALSVHPVSAAASIEGAAQADLLMRLFYVSNSQALSRALCAMADGFDKFAACIKPKGPGTFKNTGRTVFLLSVPELVRRSTGRPHHREVAALYRFVFDIPKQEPDAANLARMIRQAEAKAT